MQAGPNGRAWVVRPGRISYSCILVIVHSCKEGVRACGGACWNREIASMVRRSPPIEGSVVKGGSLLSGCGREGDGGRLRAPAQPVGGLCSECVGTRLERLEHQATFPARIRAQPAGSDVGAGRRGHADNRVVDDCKLKRSL